MKKNVRSVSEMLQMRSDMLAKREALNIKMNEVSDKAAAEKRELSAEENVEYQHAQSEFNKLSREIAMNNDMVNFMAQNKEGVKSQNQQMREFLQNARKAGGAEVVLQREAPILQPDMETGGMIPLHIQDIVPPLEMGLIFDKVGIPVQTGVSGNIQWPVMGTCEAEIQDENVALNDTDIDFTKITAKHVRVGISIPVSNQAINDANTDLVTLIKDSMHKAIARTLNRVTFSHENFHGSLHGPFAGAKAKGTFGGAVPTFAELLKMKGAVAGEGVEMIGFCYVMSEAMKATLEATPIDAGSGRMIIENGCIAGYPVFCTNFINYGSDKLKDTVEHVGAGCWGYMPVNQHGEARLVVDPYTQAKKDVTVVTLNADWSMTTLKNEAFAYYKCGA